MIEPCLRDSCALRADGAVGEKILLAASHYERVGRTGEGVTELPTTGAGYTGRVVKP